jgi:hypothetical protein
MSVPATALTYPSPVELPVADGRRPLAWCAVTAAPAIDGRSPVPVPDSQPVTASSTCATSTRQSPAARDSAIVFERGDLRAPPHRALKPQPQFRAPRWVDSSPDGWLIVPLHFPREGHARARRRDHDVVIGTGLWKPQPQPESRGRGGAAAAPFAASLTEIKRARRAVSCVVETRDALKGAKLGFRAAPGFATPSRSSRQRDRLRMEVELEVRRDRPELADPGLELPDALSRDTESTANLFECLRHGVVQAEAKREHVAQPRSQP